MCMKIFRRKSNFICRIYIQNEIEQLYEKVCVCLTLIYDLILEIFDHS